MSDCGDPEQDEARLRAQWEERHPIDAAHFDVEFNDPEDARRVHELIKSGLYFQQAVDQLELRPYVHYSVTRTDVGPDGRGLT